MKAERERRATILEAEGQKQSAIERATGERQSQILKAEGEGAAIRTVADAHKYAAIAKAEGEAAAIKSVFDAIHAGRPTNDLLAIKYMEMMQGVANGRATKIFLPAETAGVMGSIAGIAELFKGDGAPDGEAPVPPRGATPPAPIRPSRAGPPPPRAL
jgi:regulator of protease activity HflC (stomatin/prohibitin superfamily)